jgi:hypothetical protein
LTDEEKRKRLAEYNRKYYKANRERLAEYKREYYTHNRTDYAVRARKYYNTPRGRAKMLVSGARCRARDNSLPFDLDIRVDEIAEILLNGCCAM